MGCILDCYLYPYQRLPGVLEIHCGWLPYLLYKHSDLRRFGSCGSCVLWTETDKSLIGLYFGYKFFKKTKIWKGTEIDFVTGIPSVEETEIPEQPPKNVWEKISRVIF